jgi:hypothetical protein
MGETDWRLTMRTFLFLMLSVVWAVAAVPPPLLSTQLTTNRINSVGVSNATSKPVFLHSGSNVTFYPIIAGTNAAVDMTSTGIVVSAASGGGAGNPAGNDREIQINNGGAFGGSSLIVPAGGTNLSMSGELRVFRAVITNTLVVGSLGDNEPVLTGSGASLVSGQINLGSATHVTLPGATTQLLYNNGGVMDGAGGIVVESSAGETNINVTGHARAYRVTATNGIASAGWLQVTGNQTNSASTYLSGLDVSAAANFQDGITVALDSVFSANLEARGTLKSIGAATFGNGITVTNGGTFVGTNNGRVRLNGTNNGFTEFMAPTAGQSNSIVFDLAGPSVGQVFKVHSITAQAGTNSIVMTNATDSTSSTGDAALVNATAISDSFSLTNTAASSTAASTTWSVSAAADPDPDKVSVAIGAASATDAGIITADTQTIGGAKTWNGDATFPESMYVGNDIDTFRIGVRGPALALSMTATNSITNFGNYIGPTASIGTVNVQTNLFAAALRVTNAVTLDALTASQAVVTDGSKNLASVAYTGAGNVMRTRTGVYRELWIPAGALTPATTNGAALGTNTVGSDGLTLDTLDFDDTTAEYGWFTWSPPDVWDHGTVKAKFVWTTTSGTGGVVWGLAGGAVADDGTLNGAVLGTAQTIADTRLADHDLHLTSATAAITVGGTPTLSKPVFWRVHRLPTDGSDTKTGDARLIGIKIQYLETGTEASAW